MIQPTDLVRTGMAGLEWFAIAFFVALNGWYLVLLVSATIELRRHTWFARAEYRSRILSSPLTPTISVIAPAHNEETTIIESVNSLLGLNYPNLEIVVSNDGSADRTLDVLRNEFGLVPVHPIYRRVIPNRPVRGLYRSALHPRLVVVDKENGGKADAVNAGLNVATGQLACVIDADTLIEPDAMQKMVRPFLESPDVLAVGGTIRIANGSIIRGGRILEARVPLNPVAAVQVVEYLRAFLFGRLGWNRLGGNLIVSGAFGLFRRESLIQCGGFAHDTVGEDIEAILRLRSRAYEEGRPHRVAFVPEPVAWTEAPESLKVLGGQRDRWHRGLTDVVIRYRRLLFNPRYGAMGLVVFPYFAILELFAPVVEAAGILGLLLAAPLGLLNVRFAVLFFLVAYGLSVVLTMVTFTLEEFTYCRYHRTRDRLMLVALTLVETIGYRQLTVYWRLRGLIGYMRGKTDWGAMERRGFGSREEGPESLPATTAAEWNRGAA